MKLYQNGDRCPCCGTILDGKSRAWLLEFSQLVADLGLPDWPGIPESFDAPTVNEQAPRRAAKIPPPENAKDSCLDKGKEARG